MSCPRPRISHFFKESCFLLLENGFRNQNRDARCACCYWSVAVPFPLRRQSKKIYMCIPMLSHTQMYKYFHMEPFVSILSWTCTHTAVSSSSPLHVDPLPHSSCLLLLICNHLLQKWETWLPPYTIIYVLNCSTPVYMHSISQLLNWRHLL